MKALTWIKFLCIGLGLAACTASSKETETSGEAHAEVREFPVTRLITRETTLHREYVGDIHALRNVEIYARVKGYLEQIYVDEGQEVKKGQTLFRINDEEYKAELAKARADLKTAIAEAKAAELELNQVRGMVEKAVISKTELDVAQAKYDAVHAGIDNARSALSNASLRLAHTHIKAPFDGVIDRIPLKAGSLIDEGTRLTTVSDIHSVYAYFNVSENEYLEYAKLRMKDTVDSNNQVELQLADGTFYSHKGKIETMEGEFDTGTGSIAFRARFPNPKNLLKHGSTGSIRLANHLSDALIVPQKATFEIQDKSYVFVVDQHNQVKMRSFVPKTRVDHFYVVEDGLKPGEKVVYEGLQNLRDGMKIIPRYIGMDSLTTASANFRQVEYVVANP
jgi:membrane fusion protein (multidrug efflux system)